MQDKIMNAAETMPEPKYSYRPTKDVRSFAEILTHVADISYYLCSNAKGEAPPPPAKGKDSKTEIIWPGAIPASPPDHGSTVRRVFLCVEYEIVEKLIDSRSLCRDPCRLPWKSRTGS
jgi:DinB family protein